MPTRSYLGVVPVIYQFDAPDRFVVGSIGEGQEGTFCLQVREQNRLLTLGLERSQVQALADHMARVLEEVLRISYGIVNIPPPLDAPVDMGPLDLPLSQDFSIGTMAIGWDAQSSRLRLDLYSESGGEQIIPSPGQSGDELAELEAARADEMAKITLEPAAGREYIARSRAVLNSGMPICPFCHQTVLPTGHICPKANGYLGPDSWSVTDSVIP